MRKRFTPYVDKMITIYDFEGSGMSNLAIGMFKNLNPELSKIFPQMTYKNIVIHPNWILRMGWKVVKGLLSEQQQRKVNFIEDQDLPAALEQDISLESIPKEYGGSYVSILTNNYLGT